LKVSDLWSQFMLYINFTIENEKWIKWVRSTTVVLLSCLLKWPNVANLRADGREKTENPKNL